MKPNEIFQALPEEPGAEPDVNTLMADAMKSLPEQPDDSQKSTTSFCVDQACDISPPEGPKVFYNPKDDDFLLLEDLPGSGLRKNKDQDDVRVLNGENIVMIDDFLKSESQFREIHAFYNTNNRWLPGIPSGYHVS